MWLLSKNETDQSDHIICLVTLVPADPDVTVLVEFRSGRPPSASFSY
jgi:hypothetical protein